MQPNSANKVTNIDALSQECKQHRADCSDLKKLSELVEKFAPHDGIFELSAGNIKVLKASQTSQEENHILASYGVCIVAQGAKAVTVSQNIYEYDDSNLAVYAAEVPITTRISKATEENPYLCLVIHFDPEKLSELAAKVFPNGVPRQKEIQAFYLGNSNSKIVQSAIRLLEIVHQQEDADLIAPLMVDEILIRMLRSPAGPAIAQLGVKDSNTHKVTKAITWLKENYNQNMKVEDLAELAGMSASSFHSHFKTVTSMSPLQFQKTLRLQHARHLMRSKMLDVSTASYEVGYSSISQFSREYTREFGMPPSKDNIHHQATSIV